MFKWLPSCPICYTISVLVNLSQGHEEFTEISLNLFSLGTKIVPSKVIKNTFQIIGAILILSNYLIKRKKSYIEILVAYMVADLNTLVIVEHYLSYQLSVYSTSGCHTLLLVLLMLVNAHVSAGH